MTSETYPKFPTLFIHTAILTAGIAGFSLGAHVAFLIGFDYPLGKGFHAYVQSHGHIQLVGWTGFFIMGISLYFLPRLAHYKINISKQVHQIWIMITIGLILKYISHSTLPHIWGKQFTSFVSIGITLSGLMVLMGIFIYLKTIFKIASHMKSYKEKPTRNIRIFFFLMMIGWLIYGIGHATLSYLLFSNNQTILLPNWHLFIVDIFIFLIIIPICFAIGLRAIPLFMRLPAILWNTHLFAQIYSFNIILYFGLKLAFQLYENGSVLLPYYHIIGFMKNIIIMWFVYQLNVIFKTKPTWVEARKKAKIPHKKTPRLYFPDYGEFGRFEWLIKSAFIWLIFASVLDAYLHFALFFHLPTELSRDGIRHAYLVGFTTPLIMGMALRMIPGMTGAMKLTKPHLVTLLAVLINFSAFSRIIPTLLPTKLMDIFPNGTKWIMPLFGISGIIGLIAVWLFYMLMIPVLRTNIVLRKNEV